MGTIRERIADLLEQGETVTETARQLGIAKSTVSYHKRRLGLPMHTACNRRYDWDEVQRYYDEGHSARECCKHFGCSAKTFHDAMRRGAIFCRPKAMPLGDLLINGPRSRNNIKQRLIAAGLKQNRCEQCGISLAQTPALALPPPRQRRPPRQPARKPAPPVPQLPQPDAELRLEELAPAARIAQPSSSGGRAR
jgi:hypothetical protein